MLSKITKYTLYGLLFLALYVITAIPLGILFYTWKSELGLDVFSRGGYHSYVSCLKQEMTKAKINDEMLDEKQRGQNKRNFNQKQIDKMKDSPFH